MDVCEKERAPKGVHKVGKEMHYHSCIFHIGEWALGGWVDSPTKGHEAGVPTCSTIIRSNGGHT